MASPKSRPRDGYPGRALSLILVVVVALVGIMFAKGYTTPHLGVDLAGGTSITLQASPPPGAPKSAVNNSSLNEAKVIMQKRVNAFGVSEAQVQTQGSDTLVVTIPKGTDPSKIEAEISKTALLFFRPVLATAPSGVAATPTTSASASAASSSTPSAAASPPVVKAPSGTATASAAKTQGDALTQDLTAATAGATAKSTATATGTAKAATTPTPSAVASAPATSTSLTTGTVPADLTTQFNALDCSNTAQRAKDYQRSQTADAVACDINASNGYYYKYALGPVAIPGTDITNAAAGLNTQNGLWEVNLSFNSGGTTAFAKTTATLAKNTASPPTDQFAILLDGGVESAPSVSAAILGGQADISGSFTQSTANDLATVLNAGALPLTLTKQDVTTVSPELGSSQLKAGLISGAIGLVLVILYSMLYYRGLGLVAIAGLAVSALLTYSIMCLLGAAIGFALNLPAICGAIVAIGITADSFVVYFERIRDELRHGTSLRPSVQRAWPKARRTILVADFVSFLAAAVLYFFTVGKVQGFAFTLGLTTLLDVVVIFLFTKPLITLLARRAFFADGHPMSGLDPKRLGVRPPLRGGRQPAPATPKEA